MHSDPASVDDSAGGRAPAPADEVTATSEREQHVSILSVHDSDSGGETTWRFEEPGAGEPRRTRVLSAAEGGSLAVGEWRVHAVDPGWVPLEERLVVRADEPAVVWVGRAQEVVVRVIDAAGAPVSGAEVAWVPSTAPDPELWPRTSSSLAVRSDANGAAVLSLGGPAVGHLCVHAPGFVEARRRLVGRSPEVEIRLERGPDGGSPLRVVRATDGTAIVGASLYLAPHVLARSDADGGLLVPNHLADHRAVWVEAPRHFPAFLSVGELRSRAELALHQAATLDIDLQDAAGERVRQATVWVEAEVPGGPLGPLLMPEPSRLSAAAPCRSRIPLEVPLRLMAVGSSGDSAEVLRTFSVPEPRVTLTLRTSEMLALALRDEDGAPVAGNVRVDYRSRENWRPPRLVLRGSEVDVPSAGGVTQIVATAPGFVPVRLRPEGPAAKRAGELSIALERAHDLHVRLVDGAGAGAPRVKIGAHRDVDHRAMADHPELNGGLPTSHPGWSRQPHPQRSAWTGADGRAVLSGLAAGPYQIDLMRGAHGPWASLADERIDVPVSEEELVLSVDPGRLWEIRARDVETGRFLRGLTVLAEGWRTPVEAEPDGYGWVGWIPSSAKHAVVGAKGYANLQVELDVARHGGLSIEVALTPGGEVKVRLAGDSSALQGRDLPYVVLTPMKSFSTQVARGTLQVDAQGCATITRPPGENLELLLEPVEIGEATYRFEPQVSFLGWTETTVSVVRVDD